MEQVAYISCFVLWTIIIIISVKGYYKRQNKFITVDDRVKLMEDIDLKHKVLDSISAVRLTSEYMASCNAELITIKNKMNVSSKIFFDNMQTRSFIHKYDICVDITVAAYLASGAAVGSWQSLHYDMLTSLAQSENKLPPGTNCVILRKLTREKDGTIYYIFEPTIIQVHGENGIIQGESFPQE